jgi:hypothetical protein
MTDMCRPQDWARRAASIFALARAAQGLVIAAFEPQVERLQLQAAQGLQFRVGLGGDGAARGVDVHAGQVREPAPQFSQDHAQVLERPAHHVAVGQEDAAHPGGVRRGLVEQPDDLLGRAPPVLHSAVHAAERAAVVGTAEVHLQDQTVGLGRRPEHRIVEHGRRHAGDHNTIRAPAATAGRAELRVHPAPVPSLVDVGETSDLVESAHGCEQAIQLGQDVEGFRHDDGKPVLEVRLLLFEHGGQGVSVSQLCCVCRLAKIKGHREMRPETRIGCSLLNGVDHRRHGHGSRADDGHLWRFVHDLVP